MTQQRASVEPSISELGYGFTLREIGAGITVACLALPLCISAGVLVYSHLGPEYSARGAISGLLCAVVGGITASVIGQSSFVSTIPTMALAIVQASSVSALAASWHGDPTAIVGLLPVLVLLAGTWQVVFASTGLTRVIKFTPYPVLAGFITGIGLLIVLQELPVLSGEKSLGGVVGNIMNFRWPHTSTTVFGFGLVAIMLALDRRFPHAPNMMIGLIIGSLTFHLASWWGSGLDLGGTIGAISPKAAGLALPVDLKVANSLTEDFSTLKILLFGSLTLALLGTLETFFALRAAQQLADLPSAPRRDIIGQGIANLISGVAGGLVVTCSIKLSIANHYAGGRSRVSVIVASLSLLFATLLVPTVIFSLPVVVLAAILFIASLRLIDPWILKLLGETLARDRDECQRALLNLVIVGTVLATTVFGEPLLGAAVGFLMSCLIFIVQMSRPVIAQRLGGDLIRSKRIRCVSHVDILRSRGAHILILELQGVLFFGNVDDLAVELRGLEQDVKIVILDMRRVTDVDTSGAAVLQQMARRFEGKGTLLVACGASRKFCKLVWSALGRLDDVLFIDRDTALEWAEERIIRAQAQQPGFLELPLEAADLTQRMSQEEIATLAGHLQQVHYEAGAILCRTGDAPDRMWILKRGSVSVRIIGEQSSRRLASLGPGCSVGEMGLVEKKHRSADVVADEDVEAYLLTEDSFITILSVHPRIGQALLTSIARQLANRLRDTSEELRSLTQ
jgi:sulfate permease, SulP family